MSWTINSHQQKTAHKERFFVGQFILTEPLGWTDRVGEAALTCLPSELPNRQNLQLELFPR